MLQDRFSDLSIIYIERSLVNKINAEDILNELPKSDRRLAL